VDALANALEVMLYDEAARTRARRNIARVREDFTWERVLEPVVEFVSNPRRASDSDATFSQQTRRRRRRSGLVHDLRRAAYYLRAGGPRTVIDKVGRRLRRR
jgi:hypothetical protein